MQAMSVNNFFKFFYFVSVHKQVTTMLLYLNNSDIYDNVRKQAPAYTLLYFQQYNQIYKMNNDAKSSLQEQKQVV